MALELISPGDQKEGGRAARSQQLVDSGIDSQAAVVVLGFEYWNEVLSWAKEHGKLPAIDERALKAAAGHYGSLATEKQCRRVLELKKQFELEGLKPVTR
jgi:hypothetical protein